MALDIGKIRNVGFVGHGGVGKTSLVEGMLHAAGAVNRLGRSTTAPPPPTSTPTRSSARSRSTPRWPTATRRAIASTWSTRPGTATSSSDARAGLRVVGAAVVVVDAVAGVQVQTEKVWKIANDYGLPRIVVINRMDRERADFYRTLESLQRRLKGRLVPAPRADRRARRASRAWWISSSMKALLTADGKTREARDPGRADGRA